MGIFSHEAHECCIFRRKFSDKLKFRGWGAIAFCHDATFCGNLGCIFCDVVELSTGFEFLLSLFRQCLIHYYIWKHVHVFRGALWEFNQSQQHSTIKKERAVSHRVCTEFPTAKKEKHKYNCYGSH